MNISFNNKKQFEFPKEITVKNFKYKITVDYVRKKNSSVVLKEDSLAFRLPSYLSQKQKISHFEELLEKIQRKIVKMPSKQESKFEEYFKKGGFEFANEHFVFLRKERKSVSLRENVFFVPQSGWKIKELEKAVARLLSKRFESRVKEYVLALNLNSFNYKIKDVKLSYVDSKWGHCTHDNIIMINIKLLKVPKEVMNYVIYHEIAHIKVKNHSIGFWEEVMRFCPNYKKLRKYLKLNPPKLF